MKGKDTYFNDARTHILYSSTYASLHELTWHIRGIYPSSTSTTLRVTAKSLSILGVREFVHIVINFLAHSAPKLLRAAVNTQPHKLQLRSVAHDVAVANKDHCP